MKIEISQLPKCGNDNCGGDMLFIIKPQFKRTESTHDFFGKQSVAVAGSHSVTWKCSKCGREVK